MGVGKWLAISRKLYRKDYLLWGLKEPSYVMKMMVTGGPLLPNESCRQAEVDVDGGWRSVSTLAPVSVPLQLALQIFSCHQQSQKLVPCNAIH